MKWWISVDETGTPTSRYSYLTESAAKKAAGQANVASFTGPLEWMFKTLGM